MFNLKKVIKARKKLDLITKFLFKLFQINLRYKEKRKDYGIEIFEYFYLPWKTDEQFTKNYEIIKNYMNFYEHTIIARQDLSQNDLKAVEEKYASVINDNAGKVLKHLKKTSDNI